MTIPGDSIVKMIENSLLNTKYRLISFERDHSCFGNIIVVIEKGIKKFRFVTDRGDIYCNYDLIIPHGYHEAGKDDTPQYLVEAIKKHLL